VLALRLALFTERAAVRPPLFCDETKAGFVIRKLGIEVLERVPLVSGDRLALLATLCHNENSLPYVLLVVKG
jgi:hypothetical protein